ncbi:MAG: sporulation transcription factor Spo0A [Firmicutes bacterium]|nr:sporulation transcription factor Spo0A [Bacillota bacterium]
MLQGGEFVLKILIADNDLGLCNTLRQFLVEVAGMTVVGIAPDGEETLVMIEAHQPDVVILDVTMPHLDGIGVLEKLDTLNLEKRPRIIVLTAFGREDIIRRFTELDVDYFIVKPFDMEVLAERIRQFADDGSSGTQRSSTSTHQSYRTSQSYRSLEKQEPTWPGVHNPPSEQDCEIAVTRLLHNMGIPAHFKGYNYLRDAVLLLVQDNTLLGGSLTKELYPKLAEKYKTTAGGVEAAIRNAVIAAWEHGNREYLQELTGSTAKGKFPTNSLIIAKLVDRMRFQLVAN